MMNKTIISAGMVIALTWPSVANAQIVPNRGPIMILPPVAYDHEYEGDLTIKIVDTFEELYALCAQRKPNILRARILRMQTASKVV